MPDRIRSVCLPTGLRPQLCSTTENGNQMYRLIILMAALAITGCATNSLTPQAVTQSDLNENKGILVGSFSRDPAARQYYSQTFRFKNVSTGEKYDITSQPTFNIFSGKTPDDFQTPQSKGGIFIFALPPGKYTFYNFRLYQSNGIYYQDWWSNEDYSIPFEVMADSVNYIGEIKLIPIMGNNFFGMKVHAGGYWEISDQKERDSKVILKKHPFISMDSSINIIPEVKEIFTPLVILPPERLEHDKSVNKNAPASASY